MELDSTLNLCTKALYENLENKEYDSLRTLSDNEIEEEMTKLKRVKNILNTIKYSPSLTSVKIILEHSRKASRLEESI